jgi:hypothetical protein
MADKNFAKGIYARKPHENAPDFIKCELSFKLPDATQWLEQYPNNEGFVRVTVKEGKTGTWYCELNSFVPKKPEEFGSDPDKITFDKKSEIPF